MEFLMTVFWIFIIALGLLLIIRSIIIQFYDSVDRAIERNEYYEKSNLKQAEEDLFASMDDLKKEQELLDEYNAETAYMYNQDGEIED